MTTNQLYALVTRNEPWGRCLACGARIRSEALGIVEEPGPWTEFSANYTAMCGLLVKMEQRGYVWQTQHNPHAYGTDTPYSAVFWRGPLPDQHTCFATADTLPLAIARAALAALTAEKETNAQ